MESKQEELKYEKNTHRSEKGRKKKNLTALHALSLPLFSTYKVNGYRALVEKTAVKYSEPSNLMLVY